MTIIIRCGRRSDAASVIAITSSYEGTTGISQSVLLGKSSQSMGPLKYRLRVQQCVFVRESFRMEVLKQYTDIFGHDPSAYDYLFE